VSDITPDEEAEIDAKWAELQKSYDKANVHQICPKILFVMLADDGVSWRSEWTKPMVDGVWKLLDEAREEKTHRRAIEDLIYLTAYLEHELHRPELAVGLLIILNDAVQRYQLVDLDVNAKFEAAGDEKAAAALTGAKGRPVPAKVGDKPPPGALRPDQLAGSKRRI
jgi:hypothetical protein